jgi:DUF1680 family protein
MNGTLPLLAAVRLLILIAILVAPSAQSVVLAGSAPNPQAEALTAVPFHNVRMTDGFWQPRLATHAAVTIPYVLDRTQESLGDLRKCGQVYRGDRSQLPSQRLAGISDLFKAMEGAAGSLAGRSDEALARRMEEYVGTIAFGQKDDGYLYGLVHECLPTDYQGGAGKTPYSSEVTSHELYNVGHMYEGAVTYRDATGRTSWLGVAEKNAQHINRVFFAGDPHYNGGQPVRQAPGHQEIELALCRLFEATGKPLYLQMAQRFIDLRGVEPKYKPFAPEYAQQHNLVRAQREAVGHCVRFGYLWAGVADVARLTGDTSYWPALEGVWNDLVHHKLYLTGGVGGGGPGEGFAPAYHLPNRMAYSETCAAIANLFFNFRMYLLTGDAKYFDLAEVSLLNTALAGVNLAGNRFNYVNPLESDGRPNAKGLSGRQPWFGNACCNTNIARLLPQIPGYMYTHGPRSINVTLFGSSEAEMPLVAGKVRLIQRSNYPFEGRVEIEIRPKQSSVFELRLRIPTWAGAERFMPSALYRYVDGLQPRWRLTVNGRAFEPKMDRGFAVIERRWTAGDRVSLDLPMPARLNAAVEQIEANRGRLAVTRGPLVYAAEASDNGGAPQRFVIDRQSADFQTREIETGIFRQMVEVSMAGRDVETNNHRTRVHLIPYYAWNNRGDLEPMMVWLAEDASLAQRDMVGLHLVVSRKYGKVVASHIGADDYLGAITDGRVPSLAADHSPPRWTSWPQRNRKQTITFEFDHPRPVSQVQIYWVDDDKAIRVPASWSMELKVNGQWEDYGKYLTDEYGVEKNMFNAVMPNTVKTAEGLRVLMQPRTNSAVGIYEIKIDE